MGFRTSSCDESLFLKGEGEKLVLFLVYVDDILLFNSSMKEIQKVQQQLMKNFKCKTLGEVKYYLGMHVERDVDHRWLKLYPEKFIKELGEKYGIENERKIATPLPAEFKLVKQQRMKGLKPRSSCNFSPWWAASCMPRFIGGPTSPSRLVKQKGVEVLKEKGEWLGEGKLFFTCFTDATWASEKDDSSSVGGNICVLGGGPDSWTDRGGEFLGAEMTAWLKKQGIQRELTTAYTPQSNGVADRANRTILEAARALLIESGVGNSMWPHAVWHATVARNRKKQQETKVSQQMEQITMQLDLTPSVWEEGEETTADGGDKEKIQEAPADGGGGVEASGSTSGAGGREGEQQQGKAKAPTLPPRRKPKGVVMKGWETPVSRPGRTCMATMKLTAGADVAEQQLGNEEALLILPNGNDPDEEDEPAYCFLAPAPEEPARVEEALAGPDREKWLVSRDAEYQSLLENGTWDLVVLPEGKKAIQCKWVPRIKTDDKGQVTIYKSRLVAKGFMQEEKQDFNEIFAPTAIPPTLRILLADAAVSGKFIIQMDISTAFLNGILEEDVYMTQPPGYEDGTGRVCKLKNSIHGLKQAPRCWYQKSAAVLEDMGFMTSSCDESLFLMDDILLFSSSMKEIQKVQQQLMKNFKCKTLGEVKYYLEIHVERDLDHKEQG
ncbi:unnamed protein product [Closterium sp. NIES-53]